MNAIRQIGIRLRSLFRRDRRQSELDEEIQTHLELRVDELVEQGATDIDARRQARREFGHMDSAKEATRDSWGTVGVQDLLRDVRFSFRSLRKSPGLGAVVVLILGLGIGINTTVFTTAYTALFKPVPIPRGERLVAINQRNVLQPGRTLDFSYPDFLEYRRANDTFDGIEASSGKLGVISEEGIPAESFMIEQVSPGLFGMLRTSPILGRGFSDEDGKSGAERVVLVGHRVWQNRYGGATDVLGRSVRVDGTPATIVGVMPEGFRFPKDRDIWLPLVPDPLLRDRSELALRLYGVLKLGVSVGQAEKNLAVIGSGIAAAFPTSNREFTPLVTSFHEYAMGGEGRLMVYLLYGAGGFVLLIACANVANLLLSRAVARFREISIRTAIGATRGRIIRLLLSESVILGCLGGLLGLLLSWYGVHAIDRATQGLRPYWIMFTMDYVVFGYIAAVSVVSSIVFGLVPALRASRLDLNSALKDNALAAGGHRNGRLTSALVVLQFTLTVVLLAGAGMMIRSFMLAQTLNDFVPAEKIFTARVNLPDGEGERYANPIARRQFFDELLPRLQALPGVTHVAAGSAIPGMRAAARRIEIESGRNANPTQTPRASYIVQTPGYLPAIQLDIVVGRGFEETDGEPGREAAVVTREFAATYWPNESAVGRRFRFVVSDRPGEWVTVIGVCADIAQGPSHGDTPPLVYIPHRQDPSGWMALLLRTSGEPNDLAMPLRQAVQSVDDSLPLQRVGTLQTVFLDRSLRFLPVFGGLLFAAGAVGLLMSAVGIYAVVAQGTAHRTREIGIRIALGSTAAEVVRLVLSGGIKQMGAGLFLGLVLAFGATNLLGKTGLLFRISPEDPWVFMAVSGLLIAVGLFACWLPARRATRINPIEALRMD